MRLICERLILVAGTELSTILRTSSDMNRARIPSPSLFDASGFLREANKPPLADAIWAVTRGDETPVLCEDESASMTYVLDGGLLL